MKFMVLILFLCSTCLYSQPAVDGFMRGKSNLDLAVGVTYESYGQYFSSLNKTRAISRTSTTGSLYASYGITDWLDVQVNAPYIYTKTNFSGFQDFSSYLKIKALDLVFKDVKKINLLVTVGGSFPMTDYKTENQFSIGQQATAFDGRLVAQYKSENGFFAMVQGGYTYRADPVPSGIPLALKVGIARQAYYLDFWYDQQFTSEGNDYDEYRMDPRFTFRSFGVSYGKLGITYYKPLFGNGGVSATVSYVLWGRNVGQSFGISLGYVQRFKLHSE